MLVHSADKFVEDTLSESLLLLRESGETNLSLCHLPSYSDTYGRRDSVQPLPLLENVKLDDIVLISHTSGMRPISYYNSIQYIQHTY